MPTRNIGIPVLTNIGASQGADGRQRLVRHGAGPERVIQTGIGPIEVRRQKVRNPLPGSRMPAFDERGLQTCPLKRRSASPRKSCQNGRVAQKSLDALLPVLYLRGISTGDFQEALSALLGPDAPNLSPGVIARLTAGWQEGIEAF